MPVLASLIACRYAALYREGAVAKAFYVLTAGKLEERQVAAGLGDDIGLPPPPGPRVLQEKRKGRERRAVVCPRGAGCEYVLFGTEVRFRAWLADVLRIAF